MQTTAALTVRPGSFAAWWMAARPATLTVALSPVLVGTSVALASGTAPVRWSAFAAALLGALWIQIGTNLANDVFDFEKGADTSERLGSTRVTQAGLLKPAQVRAGMLASFALAVLAGSYLVALAGWPVVAIGVASILSGIAYTGGPYPLGYHGLGDLFVFVFFGLVAVVGTVFVETNTVPLLAWLAALPVGALATAILVVNNTRDHTTDVRVGKRTLVVRFGAAFGVAEYKSLLALAYVLPVGLWLAGLASARVLLPLLTLPLARRWWLLLSNSEGRALEPALAGTAKLLLAFSVLFALGLVR